MFSIHSIYVPIILRHGTVSCKTVTTTRTVTENTQKENMDRIANKEMGENS